MSSTTKTLDTADTAATTVVSCPGKVLLAGGYTVLERPNVGVVVCTGARFYASVGWTASTDGSSQGDIENKNDGEVSIDVDVHSPQFGSVAEYRVVMTSETVVSLPEIQPRNPGKHNSNPYVEKTLSAVLSFVQIFHGEILSVLRPPALSSTLRIELRGDNDFYSQVHHMSANGLSMTTENVQNLPNFLPCTVVNKTGMGSSAALVTSLVGALLNFFDVVNLSSSSKCKENTEVLKEKDLAVTHNLAQFCHTLAQGKVGSGFDVSAACYGSHLYTRFSPDVLADLLAPTSTSHAPKRIYDRVMDLERWDSFVDPFSLPPGVGIMMADVCGGSETPSMVRKVLAWRDGGSEESKTIWPGLVRSNDTIVMMLKRLSNIFGGEDGPAMVNVLSKMDHTGWVDIVSDAEHQTGRIAIPARALSSLRNSMINARVFLRKMGKNAGVPIEPNEQTDLANATMALKGVIAAGVPGAGGNDALYVLYLHGDVESGNGEDIVRARIGELWQSWKGKGNTEVGRCVCPLPGRRRVDENIYSGLRVEKSPCW